MTVKKLNSLSDEFSKYLIEQKLLHAYVIRTAQLRKIDDSLD